METQTGVTQMAASPQWKVYRNKEYIGCCKYAEDAAALVSLAGGVIKHGHSLTVWTEGHEAFAAGESYDGAATVMHTRVRQNHVGNGAARAGNCGCGPICRVIWKIRLTALISTNQACAPYTSHGWTGAGTGICTATRWM
jgi:hypothetical protein